MDASIFGYVYVPNRITLSRLLFLSCWVLLTGLCVLPHKGVAQACGCPSVNARDTVWVTDNAGAGVGSDVWTCDHHYVLQGEVFVNPGDTLRIEPGTVVLGAGGEGRSENLVDIPFAFGSVNTVSYSIMPGALIVSRGAFLDAQGTPTCPIQFSFLGDPLDGSVGLDVRGMWGGLALCGAAQTNTLNLDLSFANAPSFTGGVGSGEDLLEGVLDVTGQQRHVYGGNTDPHGASGILRHLSIRHGSTNLGWNMSGNGHETDLLQLGACGSGTVVEHIELLASADDGLHIFGGLVEVRRVMSAFHAEDAFESDQGWQGVGQHWFGLQDTALAHASNPPGRSFVYDAEGDDFEENNMDPTAEPYCTPAMSNLTLVTNGADYAACYHSLPGGDWTNSIVHGVSDAGIEIQHYLSCDGFNAIMPSQYGILTLRNWRVCGEDEVIPGRYNGNYGAQEELTGWLADSGNVVLEVLQDGDFVLEEGVLVEGLDPRSSAGQTVTPHYMDLDDRLEVTSYHGAFHPVLEPWFAGWSTLDGLGLFSGEVVLTEGCTYDFACNYDPLALVDDGSCERESCAGCTFQLACNYNPAALLDDGSCTTEGCSGCTWPAAENYDPAATLDDGTCLMGVVEDVCPADLNEDGEVTSVDLLMLLSVYGEPC